MSGEGSFRIRFLALAGFLITSHLTVFAASAQEAPTGAAAVICADLAKEKADGVDEQDKEVIKAFYARRECRPLWVDEQGPTRAATRAIDEIARAADWGLNGADFQLSAVKAPVQNGHWTNEQTAAAELEITQKILRYARQAQGGRIPQPSVLLSSYLDRQPVIVNSADVLEKIALDPDPGALLRSFQPPQDQFLKLKDVLAKLRITTAESDAGFALAGPILQVGDSGPEIARLKRRLNVSTPPEKQEAFDDALETAVRAFQKSQGLGRDGIVGPLTRAALAGREIVANRTDKITAVIANMEEWRWMPRDLGATHIIVNIPSFSIVVTRDNHTEFSDRVVVGTQTTQTPIFSKNMTTVVLKPQWFLPASIKVTALSSRRSIEAQGFVVMRNGRVVNSGRVNWSKANINEYQIYQPSGDDNALGLVKFLFPNRHSVYLHDTPSRYLFNESVRLFSHGCMRVRNPQDLAQIILDMDRGRDGVDVKRLIRKGPMDNQFTLNTPIPVHVGYFTVWVEDDGSVSYYQDYYAHQQRITLALAGKWNDIDVTHEPTETDALSLPEVNIGSKKKTDDDEPSSGSPVTYSRYNDSVGDMIRRSLSE